MRYHKLQIIYTGKIACNTIRRTDYNSVAYFLPVKIKILHKKIPSNISFEMCWFKETSAYQQSADEIVEWKSTEAN
jgi:hypothetical protein